MDFLLPELGEGVYEAEAVRWLVEPGQDVRHGQPLLEVLTDKATMEVPAPFAGTIEALNLQPGQKTKVGEPILAYRPTESEGQDTSPSPGEKTPSPKETPTTKETPPPKKKPPLAPEPQTQPERVDAVPVKAAPTVRLMARKLGIDLQTVDGSGPQGRILIEDLAHALPAEGAGQAPAASRPAHPDFGTPGTRLPLAGLRRKMAETMVRSKSTIPHFGYVDECDVTDLVRLREQLKEAFAAKGRKLTYLPFFVKAVARALRDVPFVNASLEEDTQEIVLHEKCHVGIAAAAPQGLLVPIVRDADQSSLTRIAADIERLVDDARAGRSKLEDLKGATFTITSIGNLGGLFATPIIQPPQVGILAIGRIVKRPVYDDRGDLRPADMLYLSFSFDHRVLDGAIGTAFGNAVARHLRNPAALLLDD